MSCSILIPFPLARIDNLLQTVRFLDVVDAEIIFLCQDRCGKIDTKLKSSLINFSLPYMQKCKMLNKGVELANSENLIILDSDRILPPGYFTSVLGVLEKGTAITTVNLHRLTRPARDDDILSGNYEFEEENRSIDNKPLMRNLFAGNVVLKKSDYLKCGGMDEDYVGYGFEDHDMTNRLLQAGVRAIWRQEIELHLYHERKTYGSGDQKKMFLENGLRYCRKWKLPVPGKLQMELNEYTKRLI